MESAVPTKKLFEAIYRRRTTMSVYCRGYLSPEFLPYHF